MSQNTLFSSIKHSAIVMALVFAGCSEPIIISPDAVLPDGSVYSGDIKDGKFHGKGKLVYAEGGYYQGDFADGVFHGLGLLVDQNGVRYQGEFNNGNATGQFTVKDDRFGVTYAGGLKGWLYHGEGKLTSPLLTYEGQFSESLYDGYGVQTLEDGSLYEGDFSEGLYSGQGKFTYPDGRVYEGEFKDGKSHGFGKDSMADGRSYEGMFANGLYNGEGVYAMGEQKYEGDFVDGVLSGIGSYTDQFGSRFEGEVSDWVANGKGVLTAEDGTVTTGIFTDGYLSGEGKRTYSDGSVYEGEFNFNEPDGQGVMVYADGSEFKGEFSFGKFDGKGTYTRRGENGEEEVKSGNWSDGKLVHDSSSGERMHSQAELALENHQSILNNKLATIPTGIEGKPEVYFVGVAGDGRQSVFRREIEYVSSLLNDRYELGQRRIELINHHDTAEQYPLATRRSLAASLDDISSKMNSDEDILFLYLTSHGSSDHEFVLRHDSIKLPALSAAELATQVDKTGIKWRVVMVSACYSGGFIEPLKNDFTLILTAAASDKRSFGCSEESELTNFAKALFREVLATDTDLALPEAFENAKQLLAKWEEEDELEASNPQIHAPQAIIDKLKEL